MTAFSEHAFPTQHGHCTEQTEELLHAIHENTRRLEEVRRQRLHVEEEIVQLYRYRDPTKATKHRVELMMEKSEVVDVLQQLGHLLQKEKDLCQQLNGQVSADGQNRDLQERRERFRTKARSLAAEIVELKRTLTEVQARNVAAQALIRAPACKSERNQSEQQFVGSLYITGTF